MEFIKNITSKLKPNYFEDVIETLDYDKDLSRSNRPEESL
jgi:hypothetical protein